MMVDSADSKREAEPHGETAAERTSVVTAATVSADDTRETEHGQATAGTDTRKDAATASVIEDEASATSDDPRAAVRQLFDAVGIKRVVWVDDQALVGLPETVIGFVDYFFALQLQARAKRVIPGADIADPEIRALAIRDHFKGLDKASALTTLRKLVKLLDKLRAEHVLPTPEEDVLAEEAHQLFSSELSPLLEGYDLRVLDPEEWEAEKDEIMAAAYADHGPAAVPGLPQTLVLFDLDLHEAGLPVDGGHTLATTLVHDYKDKPVLCGVISSTYPPLDQRRSWQDPDVEADGLAFICKRDLGANPLDFVAELKRILLAPFARQFRAITETIFSSAHTFAIEQTQRVSVNDLVEPVISLSHKEGVREIETLRRIYNSFFRERLRQEAFTSQALDDVVKKLRRLASLAPVARFATLLTSWQLQKREMYDNPDEVNRLCLPVTPGDVFVFDDALCTAQRNPILPASAPPRARAALAAVAEQAAGLPADAPIETSGTVDAYVVTAPAAPADVPGETPARSGEKYVLVTQHCHTIVRSKGKRHLRLATLARISDGLLDPEQATENQADAFTLPWFTPDGKSAVVRLSDTITVPFEALDLCALNSQGESDLREGVKPPIALLEGWIQRHTTLVESTTQMVQQIRQAYPLPEGDPVWITVPRDPIAVSPLRVGVSASGPVHLRYNCARVGRIDEPYASAILAQFAQYMGHPVFELDMGGSRERSRKSRGGSASQN